MDGFYQILLADISHENKSLTVDFCIMVPPFKTFIFSMGRGGDILIFFLNIQELTILLFHMFFYQEILTY